VPRISLTCAPKTMLGPLFELFKVSARIITIVYLDKMEIRNSRKQNSVESEKYMLTIILRRAS